jgi:hypothetical protein
MSSGGLALTVVTASHDQIRVEVFGWECIIDDYRGGQGKRWKTAGVASVMNSAREMACQKGDR